MTDDSERRRRYLDYQRRYNREHPVLHVRLSPEEYERVEAAAAKQGVTVGEWMLAVVMERVAEWRRQKERREHGNTEQADS